MKNYLSQLASLNMRKQLTYEGLNSCIIMNSPASEVRIADCKNKLFIEIPEEYITFLSYFDGGTIFKIEDFAGLKLFGVEELISENSFQKKNFGEEWDDSILLFSVFLGDNEYLGFKFDRFNRYTIVHAIMELVPGEWNIIEVRFDDLMDKFLEAKGKKYWL